MKRGITVVASLFAMCTWTAYAIVVAPPALAANHSTNSALETWYQQSGRPASEKFTADVQRFRDVNTTTTARVAEQDCNQFKVDVLSASHGKLPPESHSGVRLSVLPPGPAKSFTECMTGLHATNAVQVAEGSQGGALRFRRRRESSRGPKPGRLSLSPLRPPTCSRPFRLHCSSRSAMRTSRFSKSPSTPTTRTTTPTPYRPHHGVPQATAPTSALSWAPKLVAHG